MLCLCCLNGNVAVSDGCYAIHFWTYNLHFTTLLLFKSCLQIMRDWAKTNRPILNTDFIMQLKPNVNNECIRKKSNILCSSRAAKFYKQLNVQQMLDVIRVLTDCQCLSVKRILWKAKIQNKCRGLLICKSLSPPPKTREITSDRGPALFYAGSRRGLSRSLSLKFFKILLK